MEMFIHVRCIPQQNSQWQFWASVWVLLLFLWTFEHVYIMRRPQKSLSSSKTNVNTLGMSQMIRGLSGWGWLRLVMYRQQESTKHINHKLLNLHLESPSRTNTESWKHVEVKLACHKDSERWATSFPVKGEITQSLRAQDCSITPETSGASNFDEAFFGSLSCFYYHHKKIWKVQSPWEPDLAIPVIPVLQPHRLFWASWRIDPARWNKVATCLVNPKKSQSSRLVGTCWHFAMTLRGQSGYGLFGPYRAGEIETTLMLFWNLGLWLWWRLRDKSSINPP